LFDDTDAERIQCDAAAGKAGLIPGDFLLEQSDG
jgi:hypothetical protein